MAPGRLTPASHTPSRRQGRHRGSPPPAPPPQCRPHRDLPRPRGRTGPVAPIATGGHRCTGPGWGASWAHPRAFAGARPKRRRGRSPPPCGRGPGQPLRPGPRRPPASRPRHSALSDKGALIRPGPDRPRLGLRRDISGAYVALGRAGSRAAKRRAGSRVRAPPRASGASPARSCRPIPAPPARR